MAKYRDRLVQRLQHRTRATISSPIIVDTRDLAELESRVQRLRTVSDQLAHVRLSEHVAARAATKMFVREGDYCVAKEV